MNLVELAQRIRARRREQNLTIEEVALETGMTRSWLSKVENFRVTPSLPALSQIASALGTTVSELVDGLDEKPELVVIRSQQRKVVERDPSEQNTTIYESLAHSRTNRRMDPFLLTVPSGAAREQSLSHEGEEFLMVQSGAIEFEYQEQRETLRAGDCVYFESRIPHRIINSFKKPAKVLCVFCNANLG